MLFRKVIALFLVSTQLVSAFASVEPLASPHATGEKLIERVLNSKLFEGPEGIARFEKILDHSLDKQRKTALKLLGELDDSALSAQLRASVERAEKLGLPTETFSRLAAQNGGQTRAELLAAWAPERLQEFKENVMAEVHRAGSVKAAWREFHDKCPTFIMVGTYMALETLRSALGLMLEWDTALLGVGFLIWGLAFLPFAMLYDIFIGIPYWLFYLCQQHGA